MLLQVEGLRVAFEVDGQSLAAVDGIGFSIAPGRTLALVGESGSGKSVTSLAIMGLLRKPARLAAGSIRFDGQELVGLADNHWQDLRGNRMAMVFQEPMTSLNPAFTVGTQITEVLRRHRNVTPREARERAIQALRDVRMPAPEKRMDEYPHRLSGGMRQRAMIAMALACEPRLLIADEPTTALDVTIQAQILALMADLQRACGMAILLISHDLGVVAEVADEVAVMYAGRIVERARAIDLFTRPQHPYTVGLLGATPSLTHRVERLASIEGQMPGLHSPRSGCRFSARCPFADEHCRRVEPVLALMPESDGHWSACHKAPLEPAQLGLDGRVQRVVCS